LALPAGNSGLKKPMLYISSPITICSGRYTRGSEQISGMYNRITESLQCLQLAGVASVVNKNVYGVQIAGLVNISKKRTEGMQVAAILNY
jgi:hypothetical protein